MKGVERLDSRAWLCWGMAAMTPPLLGRNPWVLGAILLIVTIVRLVWRPVLADGGMNWFLRIAAAFVIVGVIFNVLTVHAGDRVLADLPEAWPIIGGPLTANALVYGILGGIALFTLLLTGLTISALISWTDLFHVMPRRLAPIAVTGSVAWAFLPQTAVAWREIREAQTMRGHRFRGARDFVPIVVPLLAGGLDRSLALAEALEVRGFGVSAGAERQTRSRWHEWAFAVGVIVGLGGLAVAVYGLAVGMTSWAIAAGTIGAAALAAVVRATPAPATPRTRYRPLVWTSADSLVSVTAVLAIAFVVVRNGTFPASLAYTTYPELTTPSVDLPALLVLGLLLAPAMVFRPAMTTR